MRSDVALAVVVACGAGGCAASDDAVPAPDAGAAAAPSACDVDPDEPVRLVDVEAGAWTTCALTSRGSMYCWGRTGWGLAGNDDLASDVCVPTRASAHGCLASLKLDPWAGCGLTRDGRVVCWGSNDVGTLGQSGPAYAWWPVELPIEGAVEVVNNAARLADGRVLYWGGNPYADLSADPEERYPSLRALRLPESGKPFCVVTPEREVACWGPNEAGQVGDGTTERRSEPTTVKGLADMVAVADGDIGYYRCARDALGAVWCWGAGGRLGDGTMESSSVPVRVRLPGVTQLSSNGHTCALTIAGQVYCWGCLGVGDHCGSSDPFVLAPHRVDGLPPIAKVTAGGGHSCALSLDGDVYCWGSHNSCATGANWDHVVPRKVEFPPLE